MAYISCLDHPSPIDIFILIQITFLALSIHLAPFFPDHMGPEAEAKHEAQTGRRLEAREKRDVM